MVDAAISKERKKMSAYKHSRFRRAVAGLFTIVALLAIGAPVASADFGIESFDVETSAKSGFPYVQAGGHPDQIVTRIAWNKHPDPELFDGPTPDGEVKDALVDLPLGLVGNPAPVSECTAAQLVNAENHNPKVGQPGTVADCPNSSQVGIVEVYDTAFFLGEGRPITVPLYNMEAPYGSAARFGFNVVGVPLNLDAHVREDDYSLEVGSLNTPQALQVFRFDATFWGVPADPIHDSQRCALLKKTTTPPSCTGTRPPEAPHSVEGSQPAFLTMPTSCTAPGTGMEWSLRTNSWKDQSFFDTASIFSHEAPGLPEPPEAWGAQRGVTGCDVVQFEPKMSVQPTTNQAETPTGLDVSLEVPSDGLRSKDGISQSHLRDVTVTLPKGMSINPSSGEGLGVCTPVQLASENLASTPGTGCPSTAKVGTVEVESSLLKAPVGGSLYIAQQDDPTTKTPGTENPFDSLLALYMVIKSPERATLIKLAGEVTPDPQTGQLVTTFEENPQLPFDRFTLSFRSGARSPLVTPSACGTYTTKAEMTPWSDPGKTVVSTSSFEINEGVHGGPCPTSNANRLFKPGLIAGSVNNSAGSYSPITVRMTREDGEQEITRFSANLPPGLLGKLAGIPFCSDAAIEVAKTKTGKQENAEPSCPAASQVGKTLVGAGVGGVLAYAPGKVYLAGPYKGNPLSIAAITSATVGPFDLGTVVVRSAFKVDPETAHVSVDSAGSDPIPHILEGIPVHIRDVRVYMDRPGFTLNPTNCSRFSFAAQLGGSGLDIASPADDITAAVSNPFQAADCASLGFKPKLRFKLKGGTGRGDFPAFQAILDARAGDANVASVAATLPHSEFLANAHIRNVCTREQFKVNACPPGSVYGFAKAITPLFDEPLQGPVYLRSNGGERELPDLVAKLQGKISFNLVGFIDSVGNGRIRNIFRTVPDAPVTRFILNMQGGKKGLLENSQNLCRSNPSAKVRMKAQNGRFLKLSPRLQTACKGRHKHKRG
jgi:hypothetical protein